MKMNLFMKRVSNFGPNISLGGIPLKIVRLLAVKVNAVSLKHLGSSSELGEKWRRQTYATLKSLNTAPTTPEVSKCFLEFFDKIEIELYQ